MSRLKLGDAGCVTNAFHDVHSCHRNSFIFCILKVAVLIGAFLVCEYPKTSHAQPDFSVYARAVGFCRGDVKRPMALDDDKRVLCFDGEIWEANFLLAGTLETNGLFVVRSAGGDANIAIPLANMMRDRHATVVVYDYCISACASFLLVASDETFVMKDTLVAWHHTGLPLCPSMQVANDGGPKRLEKLVCADTPPQYRYASGTESWIREFYATRVVDRQFQHPPESFTIRKILRNMFEGTGRYPDHVLWTWNPRYYASTLKTKIIYEAYPNSQDEVDILVSKLPYPYGGRFLYDP